MYMMTSYDITADVTDDITYFFLKMCKRSKFSGYLHLSPKVEVSCYNYPVPTAICLTALIYTIDQMFCINMEFRLTCRQGI